MFQFISKISFSCYMIHYIVIMKQTFAVTTTDYLDGVTVFFKTFCDLPWIILFGYVLAMIFEYPLANIIDEMIFKKGK